MSVGLAFPGIFLLSSFVGRALESFPALFGGDRGAVEGTVVHPEESAVGLEVLQVARAVYLLLVLYKAFLELDLPLNHFSID